MNIRRATVALSAAAVACAPVARAEAPHLVDVGNGRSIFINCQGTAPAGTPTVFVIPGAGSYAEAWNAAIPPNDPIRSSPYDLVEEAKIIENTPMAAQPLVAKVTRICTYDRPGTRPDGIDQTTPVPQPHTVQQDVDDVVSLIAAANLPTPMVFVAHSYGGLILDLLARQHPELVSGLLFTEPTSEFLLSLGRPDQNAAFNADGQNKPAGEEAILPDDAFATIAAAPPLPRVPAIVLSADKFAAAKNLKPDNYTQAQIHQANDMLAAALGTTNVIVPGTGHNQMLYQPKAIADEIVTLVNEVKSGN